MDASHFNPRILVIDDEEIIREGVKRLFAKNGCEVILAEDGAAGIKTLDREEVHVILLDLKMPGLPGMDILKQIVRSHPDTAVIVITGHGTIEESVAAMKMGAYDFIRKPFLPDHLKQVVGRAIERYRLKVERDILQEEHQRGLGAIVTEKSRLKTVINSMNEGVLITGWDKTIIMCNPAFTRFMGVDHRCVIGSSMQDVQELLPLCEMADDLILGEHTQDIAAREMTVDSKPPRVLRASVTVIRSGSGDPLGLVVMLLDVTHFKEAERKKSEFVSMVTHELRAPLGAVDTQLAVVLRGVAGPVSDKQRDMFERIRTRIKGLLELVNNLLDLAKIEANRFVQQKKALDISSVIQDVAVTMKAEAQHKRLTVSAYVEESLPLVLADEAAIREVAMNLVSNAIRYTPEGGRIILTTGIDSSYVRFSVADTGFGIAPEHIEKIFDSFYRVKSEKTRHIVGTGLGLPIVKAIVDDHLGHVHVESELDKGSMFTVLLPMIM